METENYFKKIGYEKEEETPINVTYSKIYKSWYGEESKRFLQLLKNDKCIFIIDPDSDDWCSYL